MTHRPAVTYLRFECRVSPATDAALLQYCSHISHTLDAQTEIFVCYFKIVYHLALVSCACVYLTQPCPPPSLRLPFPPILARVPLLCTLTFDCPAAAACCCYLLLPAATCCYLLLPAAAAAATATAAIAAIAACWQLVAHCCLLLLLLLLPLLLQISLPLLPLLPAASWCTLDDPLDFVFCVGPPGP